MQFVDPALARVSLAKFEPREDTARDGALDPTTERARRSDLVPVLCEELAQRVLAWRSSADQMLNALDFQFVEAAVPLAEGGPQAHDEHVAS